MTLDAKELFDIADGAMPDLTPENMALLNEWCDLNAQGPLVLNANRAAAFFGNIGHESSDLNRLEENLWYRESRLPVVWPSRFQGQPEKTARCAGNPQELANTVYADRMANGSYASGDGYRFRGRGPKMITGKHNYRECGEALGVDLLAEPDKLLDIGTGMDAALWFADTADIWSPADLGDWKTVTRRINGGLTGHDDRERRIVRALAAYDGTPVLRTLRRGRTGPDVADLQADLNAAGFGPLATDGAFGSGTEAAVREFQAAAGCDVDGIVGKGTRAAIEAGTGAAPVRA